jgi:hypothetical protein
MTWQQIRQQVLERDNYTCQCCNKTNCKLHVHHIIQASIYMLTCPIELTHRIAEIYGRMASSFAENVITDTRLANNTISANMEVFNTTLQQIKDTSKEFSKLSISATKAFNEALNDLATNSFSAMQTASRQ